MSFSTLDLAKMHECMQEWLLSDRELVLSFTGEQRVREKGKEHLHGHFVVITNLMKNMFLNILLN